MKEICDVEKKSLRMRHYLEILNELGYSLNTTTVILDFGCGSGGLVQEMRNRCYQVFGCDMKFKQDKYVDTSTMQARGIIRLINATPYEIPFEDNTFDFVFSDQVFEHVQNYPETISELRRVLKPGGVGLHLFPSRYRLIEPHVCAPLASLIQSRWWLYSWAILGVRKKNKNGLSAKQAADWSYNYLRCNTNYLTKKEIKEYFEMYFDNVQFCEREYLKYSKSTTGKCLYALSKIFPLIPRAYSSFKQRIVVTA